jgi:hypothetical protein
LALKRGRFARIIVVDWSAASTLGPAKPTHDRCWLAWGGPRRGAAPEYFRGRYDAERRIVELIAETDGDVLVGFDFPFGYPHGSGLGGGRALAARLAGLIEDAADGRNNRFAVAARLNAELGAPPGPFWGCPKALASDLLLPTKPTYAGRTFDERRLADSRLVHRQIMPVWQLLGSGAVGGQMLLGLPVVHRLLNHPAYCTRAKVWPFETDWDEDLRGVVFAEMWPSLNDHHRQSHAIKDARQVAASRDWLLAADVSGQLRSYFARPSDLSKTAIRICEREEGWIVGGAAAASLGRGYLT